jgi:syntaxin-binding protein 1
VHYRVARTIDASTLTTLRDLVPTKLAASLWNSLVRFKSTIPEFPQTETCELLIVDRSIDQVGGEFQFTHFHIADASFDIMFP